MLLQKLISYLKIYSNIDHIVKYYTDFILERQSNQSKLERERDKADRTVEKLLNLANSSTSKGIATERYCKEDIIVSLTTYGKRIYDVPLTIESIMQGTVLPNKIVLWLSETEFKDKPIPALLKKQQLRGLELEYCKDLKSYKKIIPTIQKYPESTIITIDDDVMYNYDFLENLINSHISEPSAIFANRNMEITQTENGSLKPYMDWPNHNINHEVDNPNLFFTGVGGVLYPPHSLHPEVLNENAFLKLAEFGDDIWLFAMAKLQRTPIKQSFTHDPEGNEFIDIPNPKEVGLFAENGNFDSCRNDIQIANVFREYNIYALI